MIDINITDDVIKQFSDADISEYDDNGVFYNKKIKYMPKSFRISIEAYIALNNCAKSARDIFIAILSKMAKDTNVVTVDRTYLKVFAKINDSSVSKAIQQLVDNNLIKVDNKNTFTIPITVAVKGNVNNIIKKYIQAKKDAERQAIEEQEIEKIQQLSNKRKIKFNKTIIKGL